jgi:hypothetical protein
LKPKIPIWVIFGGSWNGQGWYILWPFGILMAILVYCVRKHLATLISSAQLHMRNRNKSSDRTNKENETLDPYSQGCQIFLGAYKIPKKCTKLS